MRLSKAQESSQGEDQEWGRVSEGVSLCFFLHMGGRGTSGRFKQITSGAGSHITSGAPRGRHASPLLFVYYGPRQLSGSKRRGKGRREQFSFKKCGITFDIKQKQSVFLQGPFPKVSFCDGVKQERNECHLKETGFSLSQRGS